MHKIPENTDSQRKCFRCGGVFPTTKEFFCSDRGRPLGLAYECKKCHNKRKEGRDRRSERWANMTPEQLVRRKAVMKKYAASKKGRACFLRAAYKNMDDCDITTAEVLEIISKPCHYCGTTKYDRGLDRIDNNSAHIRGNVLPCCLACNTARNNLFTVEEMAKIGAAIRSIWADREAAGKPFVQPSQLRIMAGKIKKATLQSAPQSTNS